MVMRSLLTVALVLLLAGCGLKSPEDAKRAPFEPQFSTEVGAGGSGVLCEGKGRRLEYFEVMDVYEARKRGMGPTLGAANLSVAEKIEVALKRLERFSPKRAESYRGRIKEIIAKARYFDRGSMPHIGDDDPSDLSDNCRIVQIATRKKPLFPDEPEFLIDNRLLKLLDNDNQAVIYLHEAVYEEAYLKYGQKTSRNSRGFLSLFFSDASDSLTFPQFLSFLHKAEFLGTDWGGLEIPTVIADGSLFPGSITLEDGKIKQAAWEVKMLRGDFRIPWQEFNYSNQTLIIGGGISLEASFWPNGKLHEIHGLFRGAKNMEFLQDRGNKIRLEPHEDAFTEFDDSGRLLKVNAEKNSEIKTKSGLQKLTEGSCVRFAADGTAEEIQKASYCKP